MAIQWRAYVNNLTNPTSYYPKAIPISVIDDEEIIRNIHDADEDLSENVIRITLRLWAEIVGEQLLEGNIFELDNFLTIRLNIRQRLEAPLSEVRKDALDIETLISGDLLGEIKNAATFERIDDVEKAPSINWTQDSITELIDYIHSLNGILINGKNLKLAADSDCGAFIRDAEGTEYKQERISLNNNSNLIFTPVFPVGEGPAGDASVERELIIRTRYTLEGTLRESVYSLPIRTLNPISYSNIKSFVSGLQEGGIVTVLNQTIGENESANIFSWIDEFNDLFMWAEHNGIVGEPNYVESSGSQELEVTTGKTITINVDDYDTLFDNTELYGNVMREVMSLDIGSEYQIPFPDTGQTIQYREGDDADYGYDVTDFDNTDGHAGLSYTKLDASGDELPSTATEWEYVRDNRSNLIYKMNNGSGTWSKAMADAAAFSGLGLTWRVPSIKEIIYLLDWSKSETMYDEMLGYEYETGYVWSSTEYVDDEVSAWAADIDYGYTYSIAEKEGNELDIIFCTGVELTNQFINNHNGTITDMNSGLMWSQENLGGYIFHENRNWPDAIDACNELALGGFTDWRMPNMKELHSIMNPAIDDHPFDNEHFLISVFIDYMWCSTTNEGYTEDAFVLDNKWGEVWSATKTDLDDFDTIPVRDIGKK